MWWKWVLCVLVPYLLGSISFGVLYARRKGHDIRAEGSHNTGASNALRVVGVKTGLMTFVSDVLKAVIAILFGKWLLGEYGGADCHTSDIGHWFAMTRDERFATYHGLD